MSSAARGRAAGPVLVADAVTLFPEMFAAITQSGVTRRALDEGRWSLAFTNPRDFTQDLHRTVDDRPYGGGPGMVMLPAPLEAAIAAAKARQAAQGVAASRVVYLSPQGAPLTHARVMRFVEAAGQEGVVLLCGRYEGIDERLIERCVDEEISIGDFVLSGGELPAMALLDAVVRQLPDDGVQQGHRRDLASRENEIPDRNFLIDTAFDQTLVNPFVTAAEKH